VSASLPVTPVPGLGSWWLWITLLSIAAAAFEYDADLLVGGELPSCASLDLTILRSGDWPSHPI
jgi:hypothetical protein